MKRICNTASPDRYLLLKEYAKRMKDRPTDAENILWENIRNKQLGVKFNRQHIIGDYIVDFVCLEKGLVIEVDGEYHHEEKQNEEDALRTKDLNAMGFTVIRFDNEEIYTDIDSVIDRIYDVIE